MDPLSWLVGSRLQSVRRNDHDWLFTFDGPATLVVWCLWRLTDAGRVRLASEDDGQRFGLPAPVDAAGEAARCLAGAVVTAVDVRDGALDLELRFGTGHALQVIPTSAGYEAWTAVGPPPDRRQVVAVGGGELAFVGRPAAGG